MKRTKQVKSSEEGKSGEKNVEEEERGNETPKALLIDVVLQNIFKYLGYKDLKSCRQVGNTTWLRNSKKGWWARTKVTFEGGPSTANKITDYLKQTEISSNATNYRFRYFGYIDGTFQQFWESVGHSIKFLEVKVFRFPSAHSFRKFVYTQCPNLEKLVFETVYTHTNVMTDAVEFLKPEEPQFGEHTNLKFLKFGDAVLPVSWMELLSHLPNLQALKGVVHSTEIYNAISTIRQKDPKKLKLNYIDIHCYSKKDYEQSLCSVLLDSNLSFEIIRINTANCGTKTLTDILDLNAESLLEFYFNGEKNQLLKLPEQPLHHLSKLSIFWGQFAGDIFKSTPNVRSVTLWYNTLIDDDSPTEPPPVVNSCKEFALHICGKWSETPKSHLEFFLNAFPNVEVLDITELDNLGFSMICQHWRKLVSWTLSFSAVNAFGLLGFLPDSKTQRTRNPNITDLKDLQVFSMKTYQRQRQMKNGSMILKELEGLRHLKKFHLEGYKLNRSPSWKKIFTKYSGN